MTMGTKLTAASALGLVLGHFLYQAVFAAQNWNAATERGYFTLMTALCVWATVRGQFKGSDA